MKQKSEIPQATNRQAMGFFHLVNIGTNIVEIKFKALK